MGRPYLKELGLLRDTYGWARNEDVLALRHAVDVLRRRPLLLVGSGGSLSVCAFAARLHEHYARLPARVMTPLEFIHHPQPPETGVLFLSAGGSNPDILAAASHATSAQYESVVSLCTRSRTSLTSLLREQPCAIGIEVVGPSRKDGFLATNSLILSCTLLARAYGVEMPAALPSLELLGQALDDRRQQLETVDLLEPAPSGALGASDIERPFLIVLADGWGVAPSLDLESKWSECGFGSVTVTDSRNFAHGRHLGFSRRSEETLVLGVQLGSSQEGAAVALTRTLDLLPRNSAAAVLRSPFTQAPGAVDLFVRVLVFTGLIGQLRGVDPGRPSVPKFGRSLYRSGIPRASFGTSSLSEEDVWIKRKVTPWVWSQAGETTRGIWRERCREWRNTAENAVVGAVVLDYDGTICETKDRRNPPTAEFGRELSRLIECGLLLGVATGRGDSVLGALRQVLQEDFWPKVLVGMYNGAVVATLDQELPSSEADPSLAAAKAALEESPALARAVRIVGKPHQLSVRPRIPLPEGLLYRLVLEALQGDGSHLGVRAAASGHSVDVVATETAKENVVVQIQRLLSASGNSATSTVLTIGDQGQVGGNDFGLLDHPLGLTVDRASSNFRCCWNVAPSGVRNTRATLAYLAAIESSESGECRWSARRSSEPTPVSGSRAWRKS